MPPRQLVPVEPQDAQDAEEPRCNALRQTDRQTHCPCPRSITGELKTPAQAVYKQSKSYPIAYLHLVYGIHSLFVNVCV